MIRFLQEHQNPKNKETVKQSIVLSELFYVVSHSFFLDTSEAVVEKTRQEDNIMETEDWQPEEKNSVEATTTTTATAAVDQESSLEDVEDGEEASSSVRPTGTSVTEDDEDNKRSEPKNKTLLKIMKMLSFNKSDG